MSGGGIFADGHRSPDSLRTALQNISADLNGLWVPNGLVFSSNNVTGWTATVGPNLTSTTNKGTRSTIGNKIGVTFPAGVLAYLTGAVATACKTAIAYVDMPSLPFSNYLACVRVEASNELLIGTGSASTLYDQGSTSRYVDGVATANVTSGEHVIGATANAGGTTINVGCHNSIAARAWSGTIFAVATYSTVLTSANVIASQRAVARWFRKQI